MVTEKKNGVLTRVFSISEDEDAEDWEFVDPATKETVIVPLSEFGHTLSKFTFNDLWKVAKFLNAEARVKAAAMVVAGTDHYHVLAVPGDIQTARITQAAAAAAARVARVARATSSHDRSRVLGCRSSPRYRTALSTPSGTTVTTASHSRSKASGNEKVNGACLRRRQHNWRHRRQGRRESTQLCR